MAETINPATNASPVPSAPNPLPATPISPVNPKNPSKLMKKLLQFMTKTTFMIIGLSLLVACILIKIQFLPIPGFLKLVLDQIFAHFVYFVGALGLFFLGLTRTMASTEYSVEMKKNRKYPHSWKIPLISTQAFFFYVGSIYAFAVAFGWGKPISNSMGLVFLLFLFFIYVLWYLAAHSLNRLPAIAGLRMSLVALSLAGISFALWVVAQMVFISLLVGFLALIAVLMASILKAKGVEEIMSRTKITCLVISVILLAHVGWHALPFNNPRADLVGLIPTTKGLKSTVTSLSYFQNEAKPDDIKIASSQTDSGGWTLLVQDMNQNPTSQRFHRLKFQPASKIFVPSSCKTGNSFCWMKLKMVTGDYGR